MKTLKWFLLGVASIIIVGCADSHSLNVTRDDTNVKLTPDNAAYVALPQDGQYGKHYYSGSGRMVSQTIKGELVTTLNNVVIAKQPEDYQSALDFAASRKFDYLVYPSILHWEDRATEWSAKADRVKVKLVVVNVKTKQVIKSGIIEGKSGLATFGGDRPQDLLPEPTKEFLSSMF
ncbi:DUF4823 domain-containing protein [Vibrio brasiliensis]|jgi:hypothetical protein|uniref:DUF4823 domain-containing protein n=1 Tax=Vibrio brasiliensis TaxID=170652 RepID=UPI001EFEF0FB|nr:DUF4823 domain-containing protein [Vibrio brasiliensis]MCG9725053.1 DUF4823 domain-containing protein [Vibrio brasiliensis]MCG9782497.1 DUF4823 domain-containing protein [Vibrio brasiliensis]